MTAVRITCPATSANLGPGFDALGVALSLTNAFELSEADGFSVEASGPGAERLTGQPAENLVVRAYQAGREALGLDPAPGLAVRATVGVPPARGLGSSATATLAGLLAANALAGPSAPGGPLSRDALIDLATRLEGHPDNVVPCLIGGACVAVQDEDGRVITLRLDLQRPPAFVVAIPRDLELSTEAMRRALPAQVPLSDASFNVGRAALLVAALLQGAQSALPYALEDRLHQPHRGPHVPGFEEVRRAARRAGALGVVLSGSGPTLLALAPDGPVAEGVRASMEAAWSAAGVVADARLVSIEARGARVERVQST